MTGKNPNLGPQFNPVTPPEIDGGHYPKFSASVRTPGLAGQPDKTRARMRLKSRADYHPVNADGMSVIAHDARSDGRPAAWHSTAELN